MNTCQDEVEDGCECVCAALLKVSGAEAACEQQVLAQVLHEELWHAAEQPRDGRGRRSVDGEGHLLEGRAQLVLVSGEGGLER